MLSDEVSQLHFWISFHGWTVLKELRRGQHTQGEKIREEAAVQVGYSRQYTWLSHFSYAKVDFDQVNNSALHFPSSTYVEAGTPAKLVPVTDPQA